MFSGRGTGKYKDDIVYVKSTETGKKYPIGIKLKGNAWVEKPAGIRIPVW